jgi:hypothetical protein
VIPYFKAPVTSNAAGDVNTFDLEEEEILVHDSEN